MPGPPDLLLFGAAFAAIALTVWLIVRVELHPFIGLMCGAFAMGLMSGLDVHDTTLAIQKGLGDVLGGTGLVIALGLTLGAILQFSGAAAALAQAALGLVGPRHAAWGSLLAAMIIGLPLFFDAGIVLLAPIVAAAAARIPRSPASRANSPTVVLLLCAMAGMSVLHALLPPHPGPLLAVHELGASVGRTMVYGIIVAIPTAILAGPVFARFAPLVRSVDAAATPGSEVQRRPGLGVSLFVLALPVVLITLNGAQEMLPAGAAPSLHWLAQLGSPAFALLAANLAGLALLFRGEVRMDEVKARIWAEAMKPAGTVLLSIGAGGALKQVLIAAGMSDAMTRLAAAGLVSPLVMGWFVAVLIRISTGSATVATITAAGMMHGVAAGAGVAPEWMVLAIGAGSVFFSHVNDAGFWLVKTYLGTSTLDTFKTWSVLETIISVVGLLGVLAASRLI
jgi:GntP family gluconate:H+ symporter